MYEFDFSVYIFLTNIYLIYSELAQLAEHLTVNQVVAGSSPAFGAKTKNQVKYSYLAQLAEHLTVNQVVAGSSPAVGAIKEKHEPSSCFSFIPFVGLVLLTSNTGRRSQN